MIRLAPLVGPIGVFASQTSPAEKGRTARRRDGEAKQKERSKIGERRSRLGTVRVRIWVRVAGLRLRVWGEKVDGMHPCIHDIRIPALFSRLLGGFEDHRHETEGPLEFKRVST